MKYNLVLVLASICCITSTSLFGCIHKDIMNTNENLQTIAEQLEESRVEIAMPRVAAPTSDNRIYISNSVIVKDSTDVVIGEIPQPTQTVSEPEIVEPTLSQADARLIGLIVMGEAEGESEYGKRLVADTILNRMDSLYFPDTVHDVTHQAGQYTCVWNGRLNRVKVTDEIYNLVQEEAANRTNSDVIFFRTNHYSDYGTPVLQEGHHYFSSL